MKMTTLFLLSAVLIMCFAGRVLANSAPLVSNVVASQRTDDSGIVDIYYTLSDADNDDCTISIAVSNNGGSSWDVTVSPSALSGDLTNVSPGRRHITWNSKADLPGEYGTNYKVKVAADDGHLYLVERNPADPNWPVVAGGAWGKMTYRTRAPRFRFVFNAHGLVAGQEYTLIYYPDKEGNPWPRQDIICLGSDRANEDGNVYIEEVVDTGDLPNPDTDINEGAKIWLVLSDDVDCDDEMIVGWNPTEYLFGYDLIRFDSTLD